MTMFETFSVQAMTPQNHNRTKLNSSSENLEKKEEKPNVINGAAASVNYFQNIRRFMRTSATILISGPLKDDTFIYITPVRWFDKGPFKYLIDFHPLMPVQCLLAFANTLLTRLLILFLIFGYILYLHSMYVR